MNVQSSAQLPRFLLRAVRLIECNAGRADAGQEFSATAVDAAHWLRAGEAELVDPAELRPLLRDLGRPRWLVPVQLGADLVPAR